MNINKPRKDFFGLRYPNHQPIYLDRFGIEFQVVGMLVSGKYGMNLLIVLPNIDIKGSSTIVRPTQDQWIQLLKQTDDPEYFETDPSGQIVKAIHRKNQRQIAYAIQWDVYRKAGFKCEYCLRDTIPLTIDHYLPVELGGDDEISNLRAACRPCNQKKGNLHPDEWEKIK